MGLVIHKNYTLWLASSLMHGGNSNVQSNVSSTDVNGTSHTTIYANNNNINAFFSDSTTSCYASSDSTATWSDYARTKISTVNAGMVYGYTGTTITESSDGYILSRNFPLQNTSSTDSVTVNSIYWQTDIKYAQNYSYSSVLLATYIFDEPITLEAGQTKVMRLSIKLPFVTNE